ncbi:MAG TPA: RNA 2',3'-cyclic phosphodiesterase [Mariprofundaceae bacterium]|nr:RNA 2',3'-cyclic phosphodiesterase [Mariprofundaceae bacterium]
MRLFASLAIPDDIREELHAWWESANADFHPALWRDVPPQNWHLTLAFFGDVDGRDTDDLAEALADCARRHAPLALHIQGFGAFPNLMRPRVLWAGVADAEASAGKLARLARCCRLAGRATVRKRSARDEPFRGHVTLARASQAAAPLEAEVLQAMPEMPELAWTAGTLCLMQSILRPEGAQYRILEAFPLGE